MELWERICQDLPVDDGNDMDFLLEFADLLRSAVQRKAMDEVCSLIRYTVAHSFHEAFYWALGIMEESYAGTDALPAGLECDVGMLIPAYDAFIDRLSVDLNPYANEVVELRDENGEVQSFFNVIRYKTGFSHIELVTRENFDARDNDYIRYLLVFG